MGVTCRLHNTHNALGWAPLLKDGLDRSLHKTSTAGHQHFTPFVEIIGSHSERSIWARPEGSGSVPPRQAEASLFDEEDAIVVGSYTIRMVTSMFLMLALALIIWLGAYSSRRVGLKLAQDFTYRVLISRLLLWKKQGPTARGQSG